MDKLDRSATELELARHLRAEQQLTRRLRWDRRVLFGALIGLVIGGTVVFADLGSDFAARLDLERRISAYHERREAELQQALDEVQWCRPRVR